jgi:hypothetical protein
MLARAPGDVTRANAAQANVPHRQDVHPIQPAATGQCAQLRRQRTRVADQRARAADSAQISQRRAAGMRCAAGQLTGRRADCPADPRTSGGRGRRRWWAFQPGPGRCAEPAGPRFPSVHAKTGPITGSTCAGRTVATTGRPVRRSRPRRRAPRASGRSRRRQAGPIAWRPKAWPGLAVGRFTQAEPCPAGDYLAPLWGGDGWVLRRQPGRTTLRPRSVSMFQESPGCPPGSGTPVAGPPDSSSAPGSTPNPNGDAPCHCPGPQGTVRRGSGMGELRERARRKRHTWPVPPPASRWLPAHASLGTP